MEALRWPLRGAVVVVPGLRPLDGVDAPCPPVDGCEALDGALGVLALPPPAEGGCVPEPPPTVTGGSPPPLTLTEGAWFVWPLPPGSAEPASPSALSSVSPSVGAAPLGIGTSASSASSNAVADARRLPCRKMCDPCLFRVISSRGADCYLPGRPIPSRTLGGWTKSTSAAYGGFGYRYTPDG